MPRMEPVLETLRMPQSPAWASPDEIENARRVQDRMLRRPSPRLRTLDFAGCYLPARGIGGDYCDFIDLGDCRMALVLGDIAGKGVSAALMMASLQAIVRSRCDNRAGGLNQLLAVVNRLFCECTSARDFASLFFAEYDDATRMLRYVNCGHLPPLLIRRDLSIERLAATATILGMFEDWQSEEREIRLEPGDLMVLYSDGLTEAVDARESEFGEERLLGVLRGRERSDLRTLLRGIVAAVRDHGEGELCDDLTVVVARCRPAPGFAEMGHWPIIEMLKEVCPC